MSFNDIVNQEIAKKILTSAIEDDRIHHSYLFFGPEGSGKKLTALEFAKALNCLKRENTEPCDSCSPCRKITGYIHPDVIWTSPSGPKRVIGINAIRNLEQFAQLKSLEARHKVFVVEKVENLTKEAGNSFLKTLEEPPSNVIIILLSAFPDRILPTIVSRCQRIKFLSLSPLEGIKVVKKRFNVEEEKAHVLYFVCSGKIKWIELWIESNLWSLRDKIFEFLINIFSQAKRDYDAPLTMAELITETISAFTDKVKKEKQSSVKELEKNLSSSQLKNIKALKQAEMEGLKKEIVKLIFSIIKSFYADLFAINHGMEFITNKDKKTFLKKKAKDFSNSYISEAIEEIERNDAFLDSGANLSLTFQVLFINLFCNVQY
jgi:DNA polymerase-3 subunit delta'